MFNKKYLFVFLALLIACMSVAVAADVNVSTDDSTAITDDTQTDISDVQQQTSVSENNIITKENKNLKEEQTPIVVNSESDFNNLFNSDGYLTGVTDGSTIKINTDISKNEKSYIIDKAINLTSDYNNTIDLNTSMGYNLPNSQLHYTSFNFVAGAAGSNITNIHFHNTEIYVNNTNRIVFDGISVTVTDNAVGTEVGIMSIRDDSTNITVKNSYFNTNNNGGYSTLVLAGSSYSTIDNNTIIGSGNVGNLLYLTTYNVANIAEDNIELNSYNNITNNTISRAEGESDITYGITLTGHDNLIANNIVNIYGQGITTQWAYTDPATPQIGNNSERYKGNYYYNNTINNGASFKATNNSTIENNTLTGTLTSGVNSTVKNNTVTKKVTAQAGSSLYNNTIFDGVLINGQNVRLIDNNISKTVNTTYDNIYIEYNHICGKIKVPTTTTNVTVQNNIYCKDTISGNPTTFVNNAHCTGSCTANTCGCSHDTPNSRGNLKGEGQIIELTSENIYDYFEFDDEEFYMPRSIQNRNAGNTFIFDQSAFDEMKQADYVTLSCPNATFTAKDNPTLNTILFITDTPNYIGNFTVKYNKNKDHYYAGVIYLNGGMTKKDTPCVIENITVTVNYDYDLPDEIIRMIVIQCDKDPSHIIYDEDGNPYLLEYVIRNSNINMNIPSDNINWEARAKPIIIPIELVSTVQGNTGNDTGKNCIIENNNITLNESEYYRNYSTIWSIFNCKNNTKILNNNMYMSGEKYLYAIENAASNTTISGNNIVVNGTHYTAGVYITGLNMQNNTVENNNITLYSGYGHAGTNGAEEDSGYAVVIEDRGYGGKTYDENKGSAVYNNKILNNNITSYGNNPYSIEHFGGKNTTIAGNNIYAHGYNPAGIALTGVNVTIANNTIKSYAITNVTGGTVDYFPAVSTGVLLQWSRNTTVTNNTIEVENATGITANKYTELYITQNNITTTDNYAISLTNVQQSNVTENYLIARTLKGNSAVNDFNGTDNTVENNQPVDETPKFNATIIFEADDEYDTSEDIMISGELNGEDEVPLVDEDVTITITFSDGSQITNTVTTDDEGFAYIIESNNLIAGEATITIEYAGNDEYNEATFECTTTITSSEPTKIETEIDVGFDSEYDFKYSKPVQFTVSVHDENNQRIREGNVTIYNGEEALRTINLAQSTGCMMVLGDAGIYNLLAVYEGTENYAESSVEIDEIEIFPCDTTTTISVDKTQVTEGEEVTFTVTVTDEFNKKVTNGTVLIEGEGTYGSIDLSTGNSITVELGEAGTYTISAVFTGSTNYVESTSESPVTIEVTASEQPKEYTLQIDTITFTPGQTANITASIYYGNELEQEVAQNISKGKISFKVNGKTLKDENGKVIYAKVVNGTATIENYTIPESWKNGSTIQAVYSGSSDLEKMTSNKTEITIIAEPSITTEDVTATVGATVNLTATINTPATINNGKIVFKINGKTIKNEEGKVIYAKVTNNQVTVEYTLPDTYKAGTYNITAVFLSPDYERIEDTKTLTIN